MTSYLVNFTVYTAAMVGIIFLALFVYKKVSQGYGMNSKSKFLGVEDSISLAPRKNLYIVRAGKERFLVASDVDKTVLISKLEDNSGSIAIQTQNSKINAKFDEGNLLKPQPIEDIPRSIKPNIKPNIQSNIQQNIQHKKMQSAKCSVDELPTIVDFPKTSRNSTVFKNIVTGINEK